MNCWKSNPLMCVLALAVAVLPLMLGTSPALGQLPAPLIDLEIPELREAEIYQGTLAYKKDLRSEFSILESGTLARPLIACKPMLLILRTEDSIRPDGRLYAYVSQDSDVGTGVRALSLFAYAEGNRLAYKISSAMQAYGTGLCDGVSIDAPRTAELSIYISASHLDTPNPGGASDIHVIQVDLTETPAIDIVFVPVHDGAIDAVDLPDYVTGIENMFPVSTVNATVASSLGYELDETGYDEESLLAEIEELQEEDYPDSYVQGVFIHNCADSNDIDVCGLARVPGKGSVSVRSDIGNLCLLEEDAAWTCPTDTYLHELGHNFGLFHPLERSESQDYPYLDGVAGVGRSFSFERNRFDQLPFRVDIMTPSPGNGRVLSDHHSRKVYLSLWVEDPPLSTGVIME